MFWPRVWWHSIPPEMSHFMITFPFIHHNVADHQFVCFNEWLSDQISIHCIDVQGIMAPDWQQQDNSMICVATAGYSPVWRLLNTKTMAVYVPVNQKCTTQESFLAKMIFSSVLLPAKQKTSIARCYKGFFCPHTFCFFARQPFTSSA